MSEYGFTSLKKTLLFENARTGSVKCHCNPMVQLDTFQWLLFVTQN